MVAKPSMRRPVPALSGRPDAKTSPRRPVEAPRRARTALADDQPAKSAKAAPVAAPTWTQDRRVLEFARLVEHEVGNGYRAQTQRLFEIQRKRIIKNSKLNYENLNDGHLRPLTNSQLNDYRVRSEITEMVMTVKEGSAKLTEGLSLLRRHLRAHYSAELKKLYGALTNVDAAIESHFEKAVGATKEAERFVDLAGEVLRDIDQSAFSYDRMIKTAHLVLGPRARQATI